MRKKQVNKKFALIPILISVLISMTGCFGGMEVNDRAFVQLMGLDKQNGIYMVSLQIYVSESGSSEPDTSKANSAVIYGQGATISEALENAGAKTGKRLFLGHIKMLIIGKGIDDPSGELSLFTDGSISPSCPIIYSDDPSEAAGTLPEEGLFSAEQFINVLSAYSAQGNAVYTSAADFISMTGDQDCGAAIPVIYTDRKEKKIGFSGLALADRNGICGSIDEKDTLGVKLLQNGYEKNDRIPITVYVNGRRASVYITDAKTDLKTVFTDGKLHVIADIRLKIRTAENPYGIIDSTLKKAVGESVGNSCERAFSEAVRKETCDIFGIKKLVRKYCPEDYSTYCTSSRKYLSESIFTLKITSQSA